MWAGRAGPSTERLDRRQAQGEAVFLALRTVRGLDLAGYQAEFGEPLEALHGEALQEMGQAGLLEVDGDRLFLTPRGRMLSDSVFARLI